MGVIPLIRVEGNAFNNGRPGLSPERFVEGAALTRTIKRKKTCAAEKDLYLGNPLYFYAGHACPDFGEIVLVYDPAWTASREGSATPFDSGGLYQGYIHADGLTDAATRQAYFSRHRRPLSAWQEACSKYIARHFGSRSAYVRGAPPEHDDETHRLLHPLNSRRAWTWEVRVLEDHPVLESLRRAHVPPDFYRAIRLFVRKLPEASVRARWHDRIRNLVREHRDWESKMTAHEYAEQEVASWL